jgi:hypothetical protein
MPAKQKPRRLAVAMWKIVYISVMTGYLLAGCTTKYGDYANETADKYSADAKFCQGYVGKDTGLFSQCMDRRGWSQSSESQKGVRR